MHTLVDKMTNESNFRPSEDGPTFLEQTVQILGEHHGGTVEPSQTAKHTSDPKATSKNKNLQFISHLRQAICHYEDDLRGQLREVCFSQNTPSLILVSGKNCSGNLIKQLVTSVLENDIPDIDRYYVCVGKFDVLCRPEPYRAFVEAITHFAQAALSEEDAQVKKRFKHVSLEEAAVLKNVVPALEKLLCPEETHHHQPQSPQRMHGTNVDIQRFLFVFRDFLRSVCSEKEPLVLILENLQWADPCSLELLQSVLNIPGLLVIGTCAAFDPILSEMPNCSIVQIQHHDLQTSTLAEVIALSTDVGEARQCEGLADAVQRHTQGHHFYTEQFFIHLMEKEIFHFDLASGQWTWDLDEVQATLADPNSFFEVRLQHLLDLCTQTREVLAVAACLGSTIDISLVEIVLGQPVDQNFQLAVERGYVLLVGDAASGVYEFADSSAQEAFYRVVPEAERELFHLEIGRRLWRHLDQEQLDRLIFTVLSQFLLGKSLIGREKEKFGVASLCLHAGTKAARASAFHVAAIYLKLGIELLQGFGWEKEYEVTLALHNACAEMCMCCAEFDHMNKVIEVVLCHAKNHLDKTQVLATSVYVLGITDRQNEAIDLGKDILKGFDEHFPRILCRAHVMSEYGAVKKLLKGKSDEQLLRIPALKDPQKLACLQILQLMFLDCLMSKPKMTPFVTLKALKITVQHGLSALSSVVFSTYAMVCLIGGDTDAAVRYGQLGLKLLERFGTTAYLPRVYVSYYGIIHPWKYPIKESLGPLMHAYKVGLETGDREYAYLAYNCYCFLSVDSGHPLDEVMRHCNTVQESMFNSKQKTLLRMALPFVQTISFCMDPAEDPLSFRGKFMDMVKQERKDFELGMMTQALQIRANRMVVAYLFDDIEAAYGLLDVFKYLDHAVPSIELVHCHFIRGMVCLAMAREGKNYRAQVRIAKTTIKFLQRWSRGSPHNCLGPRFTLEAEYASLCGQNDKAYEKFTCAIALASDADNKFHSGMAHERLGYHLLRVGERQRAELSLRDACRCYREWKAMAKAEILQRKVDALFPASSKFSK